MQQKNKEQKFIFGPGWLYPGKPPGIDASKLDASKITN